MDASRIIPAQEFLYAGRRHLAIEKHLASMCPACGAANANTRHVRLCHRAGAQVNQHQSLVHATSRVLKQMSIRHQVGNGAPFNADRNLRMDIVMGRGGIRDALASDFRHKGILIDLTYADPQAGVRLRAGSADQDESAAFTSEARTHNHYARPGDVCFDERIHKLPTIAVGRFGRARREGSKSSISWRRVWSEEGMDKAMAKGDIREERLLQIISVITQVAIPCRVLRHKLALRDRQATRGRREEERGGDANGVQFAHRC